MKLYVYRISDREYGAGLGERGCKALGTIVEEWPINTPEDAKFVSRHGTAYWKASDKVSKLADLVSQIMTMDPTFVETTVEKIRVVQVAAPRKSWFRWFRAAGEST